MECLDKKRKSIKYCYKALSGELGIKFLINSVLATINSANSQIVKTEEEEWKENNTISFYVPNGVMYKAEKGKLHNFNTQTQLTKTDFEKNKFPRQK